MTERREPRLASRHAIEAVLRAVQALQSKDRLRVLAITVMPDHFHILFELGTRLTVGQTISMWKGKARREFGYRTSFQRDFWEHRLRPDEDAEGYAFYMFLNPYCARLVDATEPWRGWWSPVPESFQFTQLLHVHGAPPREWIDIPDEKFARLSVGE